MNKYKARDEIEWEYGDGETEACIYGDFLTAAHPALGG